MFSKYFCLLVFSLFSFSKLLPVKLTKEILEPFMLQNIAGSHILKTLTIKLETGPESIAYPSNLAKMMLKQPKNLILQLCI